MPPPPKLIRSGALLLTVIPSGSACRWYWMSGLASSIFQKPFYRFEEVGSNMVADRA